MKNSCPQWDSNPVPGRVSLSSLAGRTSDIPNTYENLSYIWAWSTKITYTIVVKFNPIYLVSEISIDDVDFHVRVILKVFHMLYDLDFVCTCTKMLLISADNVMFILRFVALRNVWLFCARAFRPGPVCWLFRLLHQPLNPEKIILLHDINVNDLELLTIKIILNYLTFILQYKSIAFSAFCQDDAYSVS